MIKSMTGFASLTRDDEMAAVGVTIAIAIHQSQHSALIGGEQR